MLARYRGDRQADAPDSYRQIHQRLTEELGVDPGPSLDQVYQQILLGRNPAVGRADHDPPGDI